MKTKITLILLVLFTFSTSAQNVTMAKAFFKKAQQEYEAENYEEVLKFIDKTKENLNGETNPDIIYLESKTRLKTDVNINKAKALFNTFLNEADSADSRINEVASILVDIESSDEYFMNGNKKLMETLSKYGNKQITKYNEEGLIVDRITYCKGTTTFPDRTTKISYRLCAKAYYDLSDSKSVLIREEHLDGRTGKTQTVDYYKNNTIKVRTTKMASPIKSIQIYDDNGIELISYLYKYLDSGYARFKFNYGYEFTHPSSEIIEYDNIVGIDYLEEDKGLKIGLPKIIKQNSIKQDYIIFYLDSKSNSISPVKKEYFEKNELKKVEIFDPSSKKWIEQ